MVLRVQPVPAPAAGRDWTYTVPGQYLMDVKAVQATLATPFGQTTLADSSGNGWTLTNDGAVSYITYAVAGPYAGGANNYAVSGNGGGTNDQGIGRSAQDASWAIANPTLECWLYIGALTSAFAFAAIEIATPGLTPNVQFIYGHQNADPTDLGIQIGGVGFNFVSSAVGRAAWHHLAVKWNGANWVWFLDGVNKGNMSAHAPSYSGNPRAQIGGYQTPHSLNGRQGASAIYPVALADANIAAHAAAGGSNAAYKAAALADSPKGLWMLDDTGNMGSRIATLEVTNGTTTVADFPGGALSSINGSYTWTWASQAPGTAQSADATVNLVQIPDLILPAGYTIGTVTPDLGLADSWTNINIWWDDGAIGPGGPVGPYEFPPSVHLVYQQRPPPT